MISFPLTAFVRVWRITPRPPLLGLGQGGMGKRAKRGAWMKPMHDSTAYDLEVRIRVGSVFTEVETFQLFLGRNP